MKKIVTSLIIVFCFSSSFSQPTLDVVPNPFYDTTSFVFTLPESDTVSLVVYNRWGQIIDSLIKEQVMSQGTHIIIFVGDTLPQDVYLVLLVVDTNLIGKSFIKLDETTYFPFPDSNSVWSYLRTNKSCTNIPPQCNVNSFAIQYVLNGDTVINSKTYHKVFRESDSVFYYTCSIREDSLKRVYRIWQLLATEEKIFDFSASIGDAISFNPSGIVTDIDSVLINNQYRKRFKTVSDTIIEGIGSLRKMFFDIYFSPPETAISYNMLCFSKNDSLIYMNPVYNTCDTNFSYTIPLGMNEVFNNSFSVKVYPNPFSETATIEIKGITVFPVSFSLYDQLGREVKKLEVRSEKFEINRYELADGIYFYSATDNQKQIMRRGKLVLQ